MEYIREKVQRFHVYRPNKCEFTDFLKVDSCDYSLILFENHIIIDEVGFGNQKSWILSKHRTKETAKKQFKKYNRWLSEALEVVK